MPTEMKQYSIGGFEVLEFEQLASTNTTAESMSLDVLKDKMAILTWCQTQGRGQATNRWESEPNKNIAMTLVFRPEQLPAAKQFAISMVVALGCMDFVGRYVKNVTIKWPNDIYVGNDKIAGILIEHRIVGSCIQYSLCGIGLNVNQAEFLSDAPNPVSLIQLISKELSLSDVLEELLECIGKRYADVKEYAVLEEAFQKNMYRSQGVFNWEDEQGVFQASIVGVDEYGQLILEDVAGKKRVYAFKEVKYLQ